MLVETVNLHVWPKCNLHCVYCYETFPNNKRWLGVGAWRGILEELRAFGVRRVNFAGGEPTLHPDIVPLAAAARTMGLQTSIVTNAARLSEELIGLLDLVGLSIDSTDDATARRLGRALPSGLSYADHIEAAAGRVTAAGVRLKINTVVTALNAGEDLSSFYLRLMPAKVKLLQFLHVPGENDAVAASLAVDAATFDAFCTRHRHIERAGVWLQPESTEVLATSYAMVDPLGRVFQVGPNGHVRSAPIAEIGFEAALREAGGYDRAFFVARGGDVDARRLRVLQGGAR